MIKKVVLFNVCLLALCLYSCDNELDVTADYEEKIVVFALLDHGQDTQFVKVNKTFLGDGSALEYAQEADSFIFRDLTATLTNLSNNHVIVLDTFDAPKEGGIFTTEKNIVYITTEKLVGGQKYRLDVVNNESGVTANATTAVIDDVDLVNPRKNFPVVMRSHISFANPVFSYTIVPNVYRYEAEMNFTYIEYPKNNPVDTTHKEITFPLGIKMRNEAEGGRVSFNFTGERFYNKIKDIVPVDASLEREVDSLEFIIRVATEEFQLFMDANGPLDGISQIRPEYTNVNNGYGIFSSKYEEVEKRSLDKNNSVNYLQIDEFENYNFVDNR